MAPIKVAVWSAVVEPGKELAIVVPKDFTLTNAALGEDLADPKGRSVLKLTHIVIPDKFLRTPDDYSDLEDEEDEEEEEEDEEDPEASFEDTTTVLTSLTAGRTEQSQLNLTFNERDELIFTVSGSNIVHLSGNYIDQSPEEDSDMDQDPDSDDYDSDMDPEDFDEEDEDESMDDEEAAGKITELPEPTNGKRSAETSTEELSKSQKKKLNKKLKGESGEAAPAPAVEEKKAAAPAAKAAAAPAPKAEAKSNKKVHGNGLVTEDSKLGTGAVAKSGKKVGMRYIGKLANGKVFDSNTNGKPFVFVLGKGEVIKGWDLGVAGMAIGGERKLTIPAPLAYGSKALPGIPKNSTLHFEVKLVSVQ